MSAVDELIETIARADSSSWDIADHVAAIPQKGADGYIPLKDIATEIWERLGVEWSIVTLTKYRTTALAFPIGSRLPTTTFTVHMELRAHPAKLTAWAKRNPDKRLTVEAARNMRGGTSAPKAPADAWKPQAEKALKALDKLVENDPAYFIDVLERFIKVWTARFPKAIAKAHGLRAV